MLHTYYIKVSYEIRFFFRSVVLINRTLFQRIYSKNIGKYNKYISYNITKMNYMYMESWTGLDTNPNNILLSRCSKKKINLHFFYQYLTFLRYVIFSIFARIIHTFIPFKITKLLLVFQLADVYFF